MSAALSQRPGFSGDLSQVPDIASARHSFERQFVPVSRAEVAQIPKPAFNSGWFGEISSLVSNCSDRVADFSNAALDRLPFTPESALALRTVAGAVFSRASAHLRSSQRPRRVKDLAPENLGQPFAYPAISQSDFRTREFKEQNVRNSERRIAVSENIRLYEYILPVPGMPRELDGFTLLHLSDIHFKVHNNERTRNVVELARYFRNQGAAPDATIITGDVITDGSVDLNERALRVLGRVSKHGVGLFVLGNHDFYGNSAAYVENALMSIGYHNATNRRITLNVNGRPLNIWGVDDLLEGRVKVPEAARQHADETNILITHNLDAVNRNFPDVFDVMFSGHLHGGEIPGGERVMELAGYSTGLNKQVVGWKALTSRAMSYVHPGGSRHWLPNALSSWGATYPGAAMITLRSYPRLMETREDNAGA